MIDSVSTESFEVMSPTEEINDTATDKSWKKAALVSALGVPLIALSTGFYLGAPWIPVGLAFYSFSLYYFAPGERLTVVDANRGQVDKDRQRIIDLTNQIVAQANLIRTKSEEWEQKMGRLIRENACLSDFALQDRSELEIRLNRLISENASLSDLAKKDRAELEIQLADLRTHQENLEETVKKTAQDRTMLEKELAGLQNEIKLLEERIKNCVSEPIKADPQIEDPLPSVEDERVRGIPW